MFDLAVQTEKTAPNFGPEVGTMGPSVMSGPAAVSSSCS